MKIISNSADSVLSSLFPLPLGLCEREKRESSRDPRKREFVRMPCEKECTYVRVYMGTERERE